MQMICDHLCSDWQTLNSGKSDPGGLTVHAAHSQMKGARQETAASQFHCSELLYPCGGTEAAKKPGQGLGSSFKAQQRPVAQKHLGIMGCGRGRP